MGKNTKITIHALYLGLLLSIPVGILISLFIAKVPFGLVVIIVLLFIILSYYAIKKFENMIGYRIKIRNKYPLTFMRVHGTFKFSKEKMRNLLMRHLLDLGYESITFGKVKEKYVMNSYKTLVYYVKNQKRTRGMLLQNSVSDKKFEIAISSRSNKLIKQETEKLIDSLKSNKQIKLNNVFIE